MEQQNLPEGWNLVFKMLFHSYSTFGMENTIIDLEADCQKRKLNRIT